MKKILLGVLTIFILGIGTLVYTFTPQTLNVPAGKAALLPSVTIPEGVKLKAITTGLISASGAFAYRGGNPLEERWTNVGSILVEHPNGSILFDAGFGSSVQEHLKAAPWLMQKLVKLKLGKTVAEQLDDAGITQGSLRGVYLTHAHWDHVSGVENLQSIPVFLPKAEADYINSGNSAAKLAKNLIKRAPQIYEFQSGAYMGFEKSHDVYGDGSIVIVPMSGHTPGSIAVFVNTADGKRYVLVGDTAWMMEGVKIPAERPWLARDMVDYNTAVIRKNLVTLFKLRKRNPDLVFVPAHDFRVWKKLPQLGS